MIIRVRSVFVQVYCHSKVARRLLMPALETSDDLVFPLRILSDTALQPNVRGRERIIFILLNSKTYR